MPLKAIDGKGTKTLYLQEHCNRCGDFYITHRDGDSWGKHKSVLEIWHNEDEFWRYEKATDRTPSPCEVFIDIDPGKDNDALIMLQNALEVLDNYNFDYKLFFSGSRGYHVHVMYPELTSMSKYSRERIREFLIRRCGGDTMKKSDRHMIALEYSPNPKTGKMKVEI